MKKYRMRVWCMTASYSGYRHANSKLEAIEDLRTEYRRNRDSRSGWDISAVEVDEDEEE